MYAWFKENLIDPAQKAFEKNTPESTEAVLNIGLNLEVKSIQFYKILLKSTESKENQKAFKTIIKEEKKHEKFLGTLLKYSDF